MGDKDHRHAEFLLQPAQQHDDLDLHGDVECGGGLVGEQHRRAAGQRQRDHRPLPHSARHFVRVGFEAARCRGDLHDLQEFERPAGGAVLDLFWRAALAQSEVPFVGIEMVIAAVDERRGGAVVELQKRSAACLGRPRRIEPGGAGADAADEAAAEQPRRVDLVRHLVE